MPHLGPISRALGVRGSSRHGYLILLALWIAAAMGWVWLFSATRTMPMAMEDDLTMGLSPGVFLLFWIVMMVAMMFPSAAPMVRTYYAINRRREKALSGTATAIFLLGYLLLWAISGIAAYEIARFVTRAAGHNGPSVQALARIGGAVLIAAGFYQVTPIKHFCLSKCGTPVSFIMTSWRRGLGGAIVMGWQHGLYCLGCCWMLFVLLFPLGMMNIAAMAAVTALIFAEKIVRRRKRIAEAAGLALIAYGLAVMVFPSLLPTVQSSPPAHTMAMPMRM